MRVPSASASIVAVLVLALSAPLAFGQAQGPSQQKCLNALNKDAVAVAKEQAKDNVGCLKSAGKSALAGTAQACLTADAKGKVGKKKAKTTADDAKLCGTVPAFGYSGAAATNAAASDAEVDLVADVFGPDLDAAVIACGTNKAGCACQQKVLKGVDAIVAVKLAEFLTCKKSALAGGASSDAALVSCVTNAGTPGSIAADTKGKIAKAVGKLGGVVTKSCDGPNVTAGAFPGACTGLTGATLTACLDTQAECRVCTLLSEADDLFINCDLFDNGLADASCEAGTGPTPTPTPTLTPTPTPTQTYPPGTIWVGAISRSTGAFNYDGVNGLNGAQLECNDHFPGSHVCTFAELEAAEAAIPNQLIGATDVDALPVVALWAVIPTADPNTQCISVSGTVPWFYATAHTLSDGMVASLDNGTGALSAVQTDTCNGGTNAGGACTTGADCPLGRCGGPTVECASGLRSVGCCVDP